VLTSSRSGHTKKVAESNSSNIIETLLLFGSLAFLVMWVDQFLYKDADIKDSYFFVMFALAGFLFYTYRRGQRIQKEKDEIKNKEPKSKPTVKTRASSKTTVSEKKKQRRK
jgi:hypothetical protein